MTSRASITPAGSVVAAVRACFGIGQVPLAAYLGVSRSLLSMADGNRRELPTAALLRLEPLARALPAPWSDGPPDPPPLPEPSLLPAPRLPDPPAPAALRERLAAAEDALRRATRALAAAERPAAQARRLLAVLPALAAALPAADARAHRQLPYLEAEARDRLGPGPAAVRALLLARGVALRTEVAWLRAWLEALPAAPASPPAPLPPAEGA